MNWESICEKAVEIVKEYSPIKTGNLRHNAITYSFVDSDTFIIEVNTSIAPYMPYTNEPWVARRWNGKKNPNEGWWEDACESIKLFIELELGDF